MLDACEEWALPVRVDRLDWHQLSREFQRRIEGGHETVTVRCEDADE